MKQFDIELAKQGYPICTLDGDEVRIIAYDALGPYPIIGLHLDIDGTEVPHCYDLQGRYYGNLDCNLNLMMAPPGLHDNTMWAVIPASNIFSYRELRKAIEFGERNYTPNTYRIQKIENKD